MQRPPISSLFLSPLKKSGIKTVADFKGKKLAGDYKGASYMLLLVKEILPAYGLTEKDVIIGAFGRAPEAYTRWAAVLPTSAPASHPKALPLQKSFS